MAARRKIKSAKKSKRSLAEEEQAIRRRADLRYWIFYAILGGLFIGLLSYSQSGMDPDRVERRIEQRRAEGKLVPLHYFVALEMPRAARTNAILTGVCALLALVALRPIRRPELVDVPDPALEGSKLKKVTPFALGAVCGVVMIYSGISNAPRLSTSLWGDEEYTMRKFVAGEFKQDGGDSTLKYVPHSWRKAFFDMHNTNNHVLNSLFAKLSHDTLTKLPTAQGNDLYFDETVLRWPGYVAGLGAIAALTWCLWTLGLRYAAIVAPFLLALHPWYVRYATELRGYAYVLLFAPLALGLLWNAVRRGHWGWWVLYGFAQIGLFYSYLGTIHLLVVFNLAGLLWIWLQSNSMRDQRRVLTARFALTNVMAAMVLWQLYAPCVPQLEAFMERDRMKGPLSWQWLENGAASLLTGIRWVPFAEDNPLAISWHGLFRSQGAFALGAVVIVVGMLAIGVWALLRRDSNSRVLLIALMLPAPLFVAQALIAGHHLYLWYLVIGLPGIVGLISAGMGETARLLRKPAAAFAVPIVFLAIFGESTRNQREHFREHAIEPLRESVSLYRKNLNPLADGYDAVVSLDVFMHPRGYDPAATRINSNDEFEHEVDKARREGRDVFVNLSLIELARRQIPDIMKSLEDLEKFEPLGIVYGQDEPCTRHVFRMRR